METWEKLKKVRMFLEHLEETEGTLRERIATPVDTYFIEKIDEWASKILGISSGYEAEFTQMYKHRILKSRPLAEGHGDVTVGDPEDITAKTIQLKSTVQDNHSQVNSMIKVALNQLSGERGEMPRFADRLVVDMHIQNRDNTWPAGSGSLGTLDYGMFEQLAHQKLLQLCENYRQHVPSGKHKKEGWGLSPEMTGHLTDVSKLRLHRIGTVPFAQHGSSTQIVSEIPGKHWSQHNKVIHLTIKIRYHFGFPIKTGKNLVTNEDTYQYLHLAVFNILRSSNGLRISTVKVSHFDPQGGYFKTML